MISSAIGKHIGWFFSGIKQTSVFLSRLFAHPAAVLHPAFVEHYHVLLAEDGVGRNVLSHFLFASDVSRALFLDDLQEGLQLIYWR